jgi:DNA-binding response OmpR family regulator
LVKKVREEDSEVHLLALTEYSSTELLREMIDLHFLSYLVKPVASETFQATLLKVSLRVSRRGKVQLPLCFQWDTRTKTLLYKDKIIVLTKRESKLFDLLVTKKGTFCSDNDIFFYVWSDDFNKSISNSSIRTLIKNLRRKLPESLIENKYGLGYKIIA